MGLYINMAQNNKSSGKRKQKKNNLAGTDVMNWGFTELPVGYSKVMPECTVLQERKSVTDSTEAYNKTWIG